MGNNRNGLRMRRSGQSYNLFFVKPKALCNAHKCAERLMMIRSIEEVLLTEGDYGFVIRAKASQESESRDVVRYIEANMGKYSKAVSLVRYNRW